MTTTDSTYRFGAFTLDTSARRLAHGDKQLDLQPKAFDVLVYLLRNPDRVVSKSELFDNVWAGRVVTENVLSRVVSVLRKALGDDARSPQFIGLVPRVGYRFLHDVTVSLQGAAPSDARKSLAVLPFEPLIEATGDPALELGMADTLIARLSMLNGLVVRPLLSVRRIAETNSNPLEIAQALDVDAVLYGSIARTQNEIRVTVTLTIPDPQDVLWSQTYNEEISDVFALQDRICGQIIDALAPRLRSELMKTPQTSTDAYRAYLEGRLYLARYSQPDVEIAASLFEDTIDRDPSYAPAWAGLADCHDFFGSTGVESTYHYEAAKRASRRALSLAPDLPDVLIVQAKVAWQFDWDWDRADSIFRDVCTRYSNRADAMIAYSDFCCYLARPDEGIEHATAALDIDPVSPWVNALLAQALHMAGRDEEAIQQADHTLALSPGFPFAHFFRGLALTALGSHEGAIADIEIAVASGRPDFLVAQVFCLALAGREDEARKIFAHIEAAGDAAPPISRAIGYLALGKYDCAAAAFARCMDEKDWHILLLNAEPLIIRMAEGTSSMDVLDTFMQSRHAN